MAKIGNNPKVSYIAVFLAAAALYAVTCAPGAVWQDSGMYQYRIWHNDIQGNLGLALSHPLYHLIGIAVKPVPWGDFAYRVNLISAVAAAIAVANLFLLLRLWLGKTAPAMMASITFALSWTHWQFASIAEVYTLHSALFFAELILLLQYIRTKRIGFLYLLALFNGLAIANHMWAAIAFACYTAFIAMLLFKKQIQLRHIGAAAILWIIGAAPYEYLIIKNIIQTGDFTATISSALFGSAWKSSVLSTSISTGIVKENLMFIAYNFPTPNILLFFVGFYGLKKLPPNQSFKNILIALVIFFFIFAFRYPVPDRFAFFTPFYCLAAVLIGIGFELIIGLPNRRILCWIVFVLTLLPIPIYAITPLITEKYGINLGTKRQIPYRNNHTWFLQPWKSGYNGPEKFSKEALSSVEKNAIILADGTTVYPLWYIQNVKGLRPDVKVLSGHGSYKNSIPIPTENNIKQLLDERAVYVVSSVEGYCPKFLLENYNFIQTTVLFRVVEIK